MAVTKAQFAVWALISGLSVWGYAMLSRVKLPEEVTTTLPSALVVLANPRVVEPADPAAPAATTLPALVAVFPFPDDLVPAVAEAAVVAPTQVVQSFAEIPDEAIPAITGVGGDDLVLPEVPTETAAASPETEAAPEPMAVTTAEEPPIPRPSRPVVAQPVKAVPLSEVKTLYVVADALNVRAIPSTNGPVLQKLPQGFAVAAREQANEWVGFVMRDGQVGWMSTDYLSDTMPAKPPPASVLPTRAEPLNLMM